MLFFSAVASAWRPHGHDQLTVSTTSGRVHGKIDEVLPNVRQFLGIPYAQPPTGDLRWAPPKALSQPNANVEATALPPSCPQFLGTGASLYNREVLQFNLQGLNTTGATSEDCLTTSVWTPTKSKARHGWPSSRAELLPVLIFIYGGGFSTGGEDVPYQIPAQWVNRTQDHVVVSFNYRVNIFGYPGAEGLDDNNLGLSDQRAAVEWCRANIAAFGGDPARMVLWGQSAGAMSVDFFNFAYPNDPIVTGLIMDSGTAFLPIRGDATGASFSYVASQVGCAGLANDTTAQLVCMRKVPAETIENFVAGQSNSGASPSLAFGPIADEKLIFANYTQRALAGKQASIVSVLHLNVHSPSLTLLQPAIIGTNAQDGVAFVSPFDPNGPTLAASQAALLEVFFCPATETIRLRQQTNRLTYRYLYSGNFSNISPQPWMGAYHSSELPLIMGTHPNYRGPSSALEYSTSCAMQDAWLAFARDPTGGLMREQWEVYSQLGSDEVRDFGNGVPAQEVSLANLEGMCDGAVPA